MNVGELFKKLSFNELANIALGGDGKGNIPTANQERMIDKINNALDDIHTKFPLVQKELVLQSLEWKSEYLLTTAHAVSNEDSTELKYIMDTPEKKFEGDLIFILGVTNEIGDDLPMNDAEQYASVFTPQTNVLQLTHASDEQVFFVKYQAKHQKLLYISNDLDLTLAQEINIPVPLEKALRYHVAMGIFSSMSGQSVAGKAQDMQVQYELACDLVNEKSLLGTPDISTNVKLERRGFC